MKRRRHTPEQAVHKVREGERMLNAGSDLVEVLRQLDITKSIWNRWRNIPQDKLREAASRIPVCDLVTIPAGHHVHANEPIRFADTISDWLNAR